MPYYMIVYIPYIYHQCIYNITSIYTLYLSTVVIVIGAAKDWIVIVFFLQLAGWRTKEHP